MSSKQFIPFFDLKSATAFSISSWNDVGAFDHQNDGALGRTGAMRHTLRDDESLPRRKIDNTIFEIDEKVTFENEKEFIQLIVFVPVILSLHHTESDD